MDEHDWLAERFEGDRAHLRAVAYRMLGSATEADDAVQEAWLRLSRADTSDVENLTAWLTTIVGRVCLDMLRSRNVRQAEPLTEDLPEPVAPSEDGTDPEHEAMLADSVGLAMLVVIDKLTPAERLSFVLHDMFAVPYDDIAPIVERSPAATRQLASRARRRIQGTAALPQADLSRRRAVVDAFFAAARKGDFDALVAVLDPDVVLRADATAIRMSAAGSTTGAPTLASRLTGIRAVAEFSRRAQTAQPALVDGAPGAVWAPGGRVLVAFDFTVVGGKITEIKLIADPESLDRLDMTIIDG